jgi:hypothetical protein
MGLLRFQKSADMKENSKVQQPIEQLLTFDPLPSSSSDDLTNLKQIQDLIQTIKHSVSDEEARALVKLFVPDDCFDLAWSILHLVKTAPSWPLADCLEDKRNEWIQTLKRRTENKHI